MSDSKNQEEGKLQKSDLFRGTLCVHSIAAPTTTTTTGRAAELLHFAECGPDGVRVESPPARPTGSGGSVIVAVVWSNDV